ncbi:hypothetical protein L6164_029587 [Bauhinia variegata]|uniref:Uncharacterized protein n=1 Tax=Bauhinia variegata TaxID=167791 RepID=A0ACB9LA42_BAUVA|nr:hypothetical protein L6164_029587 [Bauhinia variegata]
MADLHRSGSVTKSALAKNPSASKSGRYVAFEAPNRRTGLSDSDIDTNIEHLEKGRKRPYYFACCAWGCIIVFTLVIVVVIMGIVYVAFLQAGMPQIFVRYINVNKLQVDNSRTDATLDVGILISNKNDKLKLLYGLLTVNVNSEGVELGHKQVHAFSQNPQNNKKLDLQMSLNDAKADTDAVNDIKSDMKAHEMEFDVYIVGTIGFEVGTVHMNTVPFLATCHQVQQKVLDFGGQPKCEVKMFSFRPSSN